MKIGIVRHFRVNQPLPKGFLINYEKVVGWFAAYDLAEISYNEIELKENWEVCYSSPSSRALKTAERIYKGTIIQREQLKELDVLPLLNKSYRRPLLFWALLIRKRSMTPNAITNEFIIKLNAFVDELLASGQQDVLVVSHGFVMMLLQKELVKRGFTGDKFKTPVNGKLYIFEKESNSREDLSTDKK